MINASNEFKELIAKSGRRIYTDVSIELQTGEVLEIPQEKLRSLLIEDDVSGKNSFDIGAIISNQCTIKIDNTDGAYSEIEFDRAVITVKIGLQLSETVEWLNKGTFIAEPGDESGSVITIKACDYVKRFDFPYADSNLIYPATLRQIVQDACDMCGVSFASPSSDEFDYVVQARPDDELLTFRQVLHWVGQIACCWFRCNAHGALQAGFYDLDAYESDAEENFHQIRHMQSLTRSTDDIVITGVRVVQEIDSEEVAYQSGEEGYVLAVEGNELIQGENGEIVAAKLGEKLVGVKFRKFATSHQSDPRIEAGDLAMITDRKGKVYKSLITSTAFQLGGIQKTACSAESPSRNSSARYSESTKTYVAMRKLVREERTARETAIEKLEKTLGDGSGLYMTTEEMEDGSFIYYAHNKPTIEESDIIWLMTAEAIGISTDGGKTYPYGFVVDGELIARILQAEGVNADWINAGTLVVKDSDGNVMFSANVDTGEVKISTSAVISADGQNLDDSLGALRQEVVKSYANSQQYADQIVTEAVKEYVRIDEFETYREETATEIKQTANDVTVKAGRLESEISKVNGDLQDKFNLILTYFTFDVNGLTIGQVDNPYKVVINNERYSMFVNGVEMLWFDGDGKGHIPELKVTASLDLFGYHIYQDDSGNVNCQYVED